MMIDLEAIKARYQKWLADDYYPDTEGDISSDDHEALIAEVEELRKITIELLDSLAATTTVKRECGVPSVTHQTGEIVP